MTRDASRSDDGIDSSHLNPAAGHAPERVRWAQERNEHNAQKGGHGGMHLVDSPRCLVDRGVHHQLRQPGYEDYYRSGVSFLFL